MTDYDANPLLRRMEGPSPAAQVALDMVKRGLVVAPFLILGGSAIWGLDGAASVAYGLGLILVNFALSAALIAWASRISLALMMASVLFGFLLRLAIIFVAVILVKDASWMHLVALGVTIIVTHLGLLFWELRYISGSLAYPGLKPGAGMLGSTVVTDVRAVPVTGPAAPTAASFETRPAEGTTDRPAEGLTNRETTSS